MAGKKGKKGKRGKKGKKGKKGATKESQMTPQEAILAYQINVAEQKLEDISYEVRGWEEKNIRNKERNDKLKQEQELLLKNLLKANRDTNKLLPGSEVKTRDDVIEFMKETWTRKMEREKKLEEQRQQIAGIEDEIQSVTQEVARWRSFQETGQHELQLQIKLLEQELKDINTSYEDMTAQLTKDKEKETSEIEKSTEETLSQQKDKASEKAMAQLDKKDRQEMLDNNWLNSEVAIHRIETEKVYKMVEMLERENLEIMSDLFECSVEDLKVSRTFFLTQFADSENLDNTGILEMDLATINVPSEEQFEQQVLKSITNRPQSATQKAVEDKVFSLTSYKTSLGDAIEDTKEDVTEDESQSEVYENYSFEEENFEDYLTLGPLEIKLLSITGHKMPIQVMEPLSEEELEAKLCNPDDWPVTQPMLKGALISQVL